MFKCAYRTGIVDDPSRQNWDGTAPRPIAWSAWYPCNTSGTEHNTKVESIFELGPIVLDGKLSEYGPFPVILLSHGTGGSAESLSWLARELACGGNIVIGANHHGNCSMECLKPEGFLCWWERATDLSALLSVLSSEGPFKNSFNMSRISSIGFSLGGYTVLALAGAMTSFEEFDSWAKTVPGGITGPREFPDISSHIPRLLETSEEFRTSWSGHHAKFSDNRIQNVVAIAPAPPVRSFTPKSLNEINIPITLITGEADEEAPVETCALWLMKQNPSFQHKSVGSHVGHYTFLGLPTDKGLDEAPELFNDHPNVERADIHNRVVSIVMSTFGH